MALNTCLQPGCPRLVRPGQRHCPTHTNDTGPAGASTLSAHGSTRAWRRTRARILERDGGICRACGEEQATTVDHVTPRRLGGSDDDSNLQALGPLCNASKRIEEAPNDWRTPGG